MELAHTNLAHTIEVDNLIMATTMNHTTTRTIKVLLTAKDTAIVTLQAAGITTILIAVPVITTRATGAVQGAVLLIILVSTVMIVVVLLVPLANHLAIIAPRFVQTPRITAWVVKLRRWQQQ